MSIDTKLKSGEDKIKRGVIDLQKAQPFFAHLIMSMNVKLMPEDMAVPMRTMGVDAKGNLWYDEDFAMKQDTKTMKGILCHEVLHVALLHMSRRGDRNPFISNIAQDVVVNMAVKNAGLTLPDEAEFENGKMVKPGGIPVDTYDDSSSFIVPGTTTFVEIKNVSDKTWEEIYSEIIHQIDQNNEEVPNPQSQKGKGGKGKGGQQQGKANNNNQQNQKKNQLGWDNHMKGKGNEEISERERKKIEEKWQRRMADAANRAKRTGNLPSGMERLVDDLMESDVNWKQLLVHYLKPHITPVDWTYKKPHKKSQQLGVYLPETKKENCEVSVLVDTSGSIGDDELQEFFSELNGILNSMNNVSMTCYFGDADLHTTYELTGDDSPSQVLKMKPEGGGGTNMEHILDQIKEKNRETPVVVVLTDGHFPVENSRNDYPFDVIWLISQFGMTEKKANEHINYGKVIKMED